MPKLNKVKRPAHRPRLHPRGVESYAVKLRCTLNEKRRILALTTNAQRLAVWLKLCDDVVAAKGLIETEGETK